jgi:uncharacterized membrane protein
LPELVDMARHASGVALMELGVLLLLLTPVLRVLVLALGWTARREARMAFISLIVLALLAISVLFGMG